MTDTDSSELDDVEFVPTRTLTLSLESDLVDLLITESDLQSNPVIGAESDAKTGVVTVHLPFQFEWDSNSEDDELVFSENFVHTELTPERVRDFIGQLEDALEEVEG